MTTKQRMESLVYQLNKHLSKVNKHLIACKGCYMMDGSMRCDIYNRSTRKRIKIKLHVLEKTTVYQNNPIQFIEERLRGPWNILF